MNNDAKTRFKSTSEACGWATRYASGPFVAFIWDGKTMSLSNWMGGDIGHGVIHPKEKL
jgi:hypothetical protein